MDSQPGDVFLGDCCFSSYFLLAMFLARRLDVVVRHHQCRTTDCRRGQRLGKEDHVVQWCRPARPKWMDQETYVTIPTVSSSISAFCPSPCPTHFS